MKKYIIFVVWIICISCNNVGSIINKECDNYVNNCSLIFKGIKEFPLDEESSYLIRYIQFIDTDAGCYLSFLNNHNNSIYFYDYHSSTFLKRIQYQREGPNGVGDIGGYCYVNNDSIFIYSDWAYSLYLTNNQSKVRSKHKLYEDTQQYDKNMIYPAPKMLTSTPLKKYQQTIVCTGAVYGEPLWETETNRPTGILFNLENQNINYIINYPKQYAKYNWGGIIYRIPYYELSGQSIIVSFSAEHHIVEYLLLTGEEKTHYAGSAAIKEIVSFPESKRPNLDQNRISEWFMHTPSYQGIFYDKYKNVYYRMARLPAKEFRVGLSGIKKPIIIIVLDANFNYIGEAALPNNIKWGYVDNCFVSEDGFNIHVFTDDEDKLTFYQYNFVINEKEF
jgi:hypothetical protein